MPKFHKSLLTLIALLVATPASAEAFSCSINPANYLGLSSGGAVYVAINGGTIQAICSVSDTMGGFDPQACSAWYGTLLTWRSLNKSGLVYFNSDHPANTGFTGCSQAQNWQTHIPYHMDGVSL